MATATEKHHSTPIVAEIRTERGSRKSQEILRWGQDTGDCLRARPRA